VAWTTPDTRHVYGTHGTQVVVIDTVLVYELVK